MHKIYTRNTVPQFLAEHAHAILHALGLNPLKKQGGYLATICPKCSKRRVFFYPDGKSTHITCNRRSKCGYQESIFDLVAREFSLNTNNDVWDKLRELAKIPTDSQLQISVNQNLEAPEREKNQKDFTGDFYSLPKAQPADILTWLVDIRRLSYEFSNKLLPHLNKVARKSKNLQNALAFPVYSSRNPEKIIGWERHLPEEYPGGHRPKWVNPGGTNKGFIYFTANADKNSQSDTLIFVESLVNAIIIASHGIDAVCLYSCSSISEIGNVLELYQNKKHYIWFDKGAEKEQKKAIEENPQLKGIYFDTSMLHGYDIDDLYKTEIDKQLFAYTVRSYIRKADKTAARQRVNEYRDVEQAFAKILDSEGKSWLVNAPCGSGKSTESEAFCVKMLRKGHRVVYIANQKNDMYQFSEKLARRLTKEEVKRNVVIISREEETFVDDQKIVITHKTYFTRKGHSVLHYGLLLKIVNDKTPTSVIFDEVQDYIASQFLIIDGGARFAQIKFKGKDVSYVEHRQECPAFAGRSFCDSCKLRNSVYLNVNRLGISTIKPYIPSRVGENYKEYIPELQLGAISQYKTLQVQKIINPEPNYLQERKYKNEFDELAGEQEDISEIFKDLVGCSYNPLAFKSVPIDKETGQEVDPARLKKEDKGKYLHPKASCGINRYAFWDMSVISLLQNSDNIEKIVFTGGTMSTSEKEYLKTATEGDLQQAEVSEAKIKIKNTLVITYDEKLDLVSGSGSKAKVKIDYLTKHLKEKEKVLVFLPTKEKAEKALKKFPRKYPVGLLNGDVINRVEKSDDELSKVILTYTNGPSGRAENRPLDMFCIVDANIFLPVMALKQSAQDEISQQMISDASRETATHKAYQNLSRIMRVNPKNEDTPKIVIVHNAKNVDMEFIRNEIKKVSSNVSFAHVKSSQEFIKHNIEYYLENGNVPNYEERKFILEKKLGKPLRKIPPKSRPKEKDKDLYMEIRKNEKSKKKIEKVEKKVLLFLSQGMTRRDISRKLSLHKLTQKEKEKIFSLFHDRIVSDKT